MVLKLYLQQRGLNEVFTGGLSSIGLFAMVDNLIRVFFVSSLNHCYPNSTLTSFIYPNPQLTLFQNHPRTYNSNLGVLLLEFFEHYSYLFNYKTTTITMGGMYK